MKTRAEEIVDELFKACPPPDAKWFVEGSLKPLYAVIISKHLQAAERRGAERMRDEAAKKRCKYCTYGYEIFGRYKHKSKNGEVFFCDANDIRGLKPEEICHE